MVNRRELMMAGSLFALAPSVAFAETKNAAEIAVSRIEFETGATSDGHVTYWWRCACGKRGIPLTQPERVRANAGVHVRWHAEAR